MSLEEAKQELIRRYKYLYENAYFILAPFMKEQTRDEYKETVKKYGDLIKKTIIYLNINRLDDINLLFEEFLLSDKPMEKTNLYQMIENKKNDKDYIKKVKRGLTLLEKENKDNNIFKTKLDMWEILSKVSDYIEEQSADLKNKERKLRVIDEYYKILRYRNDGKIYTSGRKLNIHDASSLIIPIHDPVPIRDKKDIGIVQNSFITTIATAPHYEYNNSIFTEGEKQQIYLTYHEELPCDLEITCILEEEYIQTLLETRLIRPENTAPCGRNFTIKEKEIFVNPSDTLYRYFQVCPHCGYIVNIPKEILSNGIKKRIEDRCKKDDKLFRKMFLYSELFSLDKSSIDDQKRLLK